MPPNPPLPLPPPNTHLQTFAAMVITLGCAMGCTAGLVAFGEPCLHSTRSHQAAGQLVPALSSLAKTSDSKGRYALKAEAAAGRWAARPAHGECGGMQNNVPPCPLLATMISTDQLTLLLFLIIMQASFLP